MLYDHAACSISAFLLSRALSHYCVKGDRSVDSKHTLDQNY
jgi:hypothetical protein